MQSKENTDLQLSILYLVFSHPRQSIQTLTPPSSPESISGLLRSQVPTVPPQGANGTIVRVPSATTTTTLKINTTHQTVTAHTSLLPRLVQVLKCHEVWFTISFNTKLLPILNLMKPLCSGHPCPKIRPFCHPDHDRSSYSNCHQQLGSCYRPSSCGRAAGFAIDLVSIQHWHQLISCRS